MHYTHIKEYTIPHVTALNIRGWSRSSWFASEWTHRGCVFTAAAHKCWLTKSKRIKRLTFYGANIAQGETEMERRPQIIIYS